MYTAEVVQHSQFYSLHKGHRKQNDLRNYEVQTCTTYLPLKNEVIADLAWRKISTKGCFQLLIKLWKVKISKPSCMHIMDSVIKYVAYGHFDDPILIGGIPYSCKFNLYYTNIQLLDFLARHQKRLYKVTDFEIWQSQF